MEQKPVAINREVFERICSCKHSLFAKREDLQKAFDYATEIAEASENPPIVLTAIMVVVNTMIDQLERGRVDCHISRYYG